MQTEQTEASESVLERVTAYAERCEKKGVFPYEGQWLGIEEIKERIRRRQSSDRTQALEVGLLFGLVYAVTGLSLVLIAKLCY